MYVVILWVVPAFRTNALPRLQALFCCQDIEINELRWAAMGDKRMDTKFL
jgi:hypothetical protein